MENNTENTVERDNDVWVELRDEHWYEPTQTEMDSAVAQAMTEIRDYGLNHCKSWDELDDNIDANTLGGMCDDRFHWAWESINEFRDAVHNKLKAGAK